MTIAGKRCGASQQLIPDIRKAGQAGGWFWQEILFELKETYERTRLHAAFNHLGGSVVHSRGILAKRFIGFRLDAYRGATSFAIAHDREIDIRRFAGEVVYWNRVLGPTDCAGQLIRADRRCK